MACKTSPSPLRIESEDAFVGVVSPVLLLWPLNERDENKPDDEAADMSPPRDAARGRRETIEAKIGPSRNGLCLDTGPTVDQLSVHHGY